MIKTVGIVTWSTTLAGVTEAHIDFGLTTSYGMTAPVDLTQTNYRTLLLGMKQSKTYHYRITATGSAGTCVGGDNTIMTGALSNGMPKVTVSPATASGLYGGFLVTGQYVMSLGGGASAFAYILDADGEYVWSYAVSSDVTGARMSYDGTHMWINSANVNPSNPAPTAQNVHRVSMDGMTDEDLSSQFTAMNHQLTVLPDETVAFYAYNAAMGCEDIKLRAPNGTVTTVTNAKTAHGGTGGCHVNNIEYSKSDDTLVFSDMDNQDVTKVTRSGQMVWVLNGVGNTLTGASWKGGQHGVFMVAVDDFLIFNNNSKIVAGSNISLGGTGDGSIALEVKINATAKTATQTWMYKAGATLQNDVMGDVQRLSNGNTIVAYSTKGALVELAPDGTTVLQTWSWPAGGAFGFIEKRATLYGPPPK
jgi:hypothetical protein